MSHLFGHAHLLWREVRRERSRNNNRNIHIRRYVYFGERRSKDSNKFCVYMDIIVKRWNDTDVSVIFHKHTQFPTSLFVVAVEFSCQFKICDTEGVLFHNSQRYSKHELCRSDYIIYSCIYYG